MLLLTTATDKRQTHTDIQTYIHACTFIWYSYVCGNDVVGAFLKKCNTFNFNGRNI